MNSFHIVCVIIYMSHVHIHIIILSLAVMSQR
jgi:hypothetical protein